MTIRQASKILGLKVRTIRAWIKSGKLKAEKRKDNMWYITEDIMSEEVQKRADKGRKLAERIKAGIELGVLARTGEDTKESK